MGLLLGCESVGKSFGARPLFRGITLQLLEGERTGLIGPNGSGKTTLLKILAGIETADDGQIFAKRNLRLGYAAQDQIFAPDRSLGEILMEVASAHADHEDEHEQLTRVRILASRIGFDDLERKVESLSGGWRKRLGIAHELVKEPDLLLLDEPTNHLDVEGILWLETLLTGASFGCLVVSHDRYFLENVTNRTIELNQAFPQGFFSINGAYSDFLEKREEFLIAQQAEQAALASRVRREIEWLHRGAKARTTKAKYRVEAAQRMQEDLADLKTRNAQDRAAGIDFTASDRQTRKLVMARGIYKSLGGRALFKGLDLVLTKGMKLGLIGPNGSGKTTLLRLLAGELAPDTGEIRRADGLRVVMFDQQREQLDKSQSLRRALSPKSDTVTYQDGSMHVSSWARQFLFGSDQLDMLVGDLSGGEQARVLIARLMLRPADLLILDEPTNDLDIPTLEVLEESLEQFTGVLVLVTHDRYMLDRLSTDLLGLDGQGGVGMYADFAQWQRAQEAARQPAAPARKPAVVAAKPAEKPRKLTWNEQREWEQMEEKIMVAEAEVQQCHEEMESPAVLADHVKLNEVCRRMEAAQEAVRTLYARWEALEQKRGG